MATFTSIPCPTCSRGTEGSVSGSFRSTTAKVTPCQACTAQGITSWRVRQTEVSVYLPAETVAVRHTDGLVLIGR